jgi:hypothetical protein
MLPADYSLAQVLDTWLEARSMVVLGNNRDEFRHTELGITFDGRMIYNRELLIEHFAQQFDSTEDPGPYEQAEEWVCFNIDCDPRVVLV